MTEYEHLKLCAARYAWKYRNYATPSTRDSRFKTTWANWFRRKFGEDLATYRRKVSKNAGAEK